MPRLATVVLILALVSSCKGRDAGDRALEQLEALQKKKKADAEAKKEDKLAPLVPVESIVLDPPYNDQGSTKLTPDAACPEGFWALFGLEAPGATPEEKKANEAKRKEIAEGLRAKQYMVKLRVGSGVALKPFDPPKGLFPVEVVGSIDCTDARGRVAIAWGDAKPSTHGQPGDLAQWYWDAPLVTFSLPMQSMVEAKAFENENKIGLSARVVFTLGKAELDKRIRKVEKVSTSVGDEKIEYGGGMEDWGAGRLLRVDLLGIRVAIDREKKQLFDLRGPTK